MEIIADTPARTRNHAEKFSSNSTSTSTSLHVRFVHSYLATCVAMALLTEFSLVYGRKIPENAMKSNVSRGGSSTHRPLGSVWLDHVGVQRLTVDAHWAGNKSSKMRRYQYASFVSGTSSPHSGLGCFSCSSVMWLLAVSFRASIQP